MTIPGRLAGPVSRWWRGLLLENRPFCSLDSRNISARANRPDNKWPSQSRFASNVRAGVAIWRPDDVLMIDVGVP